MKFDFAIGNPPYQDNTIGENDTYAPPVYNKFMDAAYTVANKVELIHPARFLFNAGSTPKTWNQKMLNDNHFKVMEYEEDCSKVFSNTEIKGGIAITYRDSEKDFGTIEIFTPYPELNTILHKIRRNRDFSSMSEVVISSYSYHFKEQLYTDFPELIGRLSKGHELDLKSNVFEKMPEPFLKEIVDNRTTYLKILGRESNERIYRYIKKEYVRDDVCNLYTYKVFLPGATGNGDFGETISMPIIGEPGTGSTETFLSIGILQNEKEARNVIKYICSKFARAMFGILKRTQANTPDKWKWVPLQNFTDKSDIDWSVSLANIDKQLYKKYGLSEEEIAFIETNVKEME